MDFNYTKIKFGNWLYKNAFPIYNYTYQKFKLKNDATEIRLLQSIIKPNTTVLDIGANIGFYAKLISKMVGVNGKVICFEPDKKNFNYLVNNTKQLTNVVRYNLAVANNSDNIKIYTSKLLNVDHRTYPVNNYDTVEVIKATSIDELIAKGEIKAVDVIKIDIQGFEIAAFEGMKNLLQTNASLKIVAEFWPHGLKRAGKSAIELYTFFEKLGYTIFEITENDLQPITKNFIEKNNEREFEFSFNVLIKKN